MKKLAPVIGITFIVQLLAFGMGVGNYVLISRWFGPETLGLFASIVVIVELIYKIVNPGLDSSAVYFISSKKFDFNSYISTYSVNGIIVFLLGSLLLFILSEIDNLPLLSEVINIPVISGALTAIIFYFFTFLLYEFGVKVPLGLLQFQSYNKIQILKPIVLFILLIYSYFFLNFDLETVLVLVGISFIIPALFYWKLTLPFKFSWHKTITKTSLEYGIKVMFASILQFLNYRADILLIGFFLTQTEVGWYYVSVLIAERLLFLTQATATILFPSASSSELQREKTPLLSRLNFTAVFIGSIIIGISALWFIPLLFTTKYSNSVLPLIIILPGIVSLSVFKLLSADLSGRGLPQYTMYVSMLNFILNIGLNLLLIPKFGIIGASVSSSVSYSAALILQTYYYKKITHIPASELFFIKKGDIKNVRLV